MQTLRHDTEGQIAEMLKRLAFRSQLFAHQLIWNMLTNMLRDETNTDRTFHSRPIYTRVPESFILEIALNSMPLPSKLF